jgi:peroxiredoxin Q/BCP
MKKLLLLLCAALFATSLPTSRPALGSSLDIGAPVPEFSAPNQDGKIIHLSDFKGSPVLLYFYPKDETPGCTRQACSLRDEFAQFKKIGAVVLGISRQDQASHQAFKKKHKLPFDLLVDADGKIADQLGVGTYPVVGFHKRQSLIIGKDGKLLKFLGDVDPATHTAEVLKILQAHLGTP